MLKISIELKGLVDNPEYYQIVTLEDSDIDFESDLDTVLQCVKSALSGLGFSETLLDFSIGGDL
jgi:hypothetical protein